jgi:pimeloyl-ACP methyl ester carboxylesterase
MKKLLTFTFFFLLMLALSACSGKVEPTPTAPPSTEAAPAEDVVQEEEAKPEGATEEPVAQATTSSDGWEPVSCDTFDVVPELAETADCGYVTVPENRATGSDATIQLAVVRLRSTSDNPSAPLFKGVGGPGGNGLEYAAYSGIITPEAYGGILEDRDWILFSQRGTKHAKPDLLCPEYDAIPLEAALNNWSDEERQAQKIERIQNCYDAFVTEGVDFSAYNSNENAADVNDIRLALGYDKIIWYGQSYGTMLGQYIMRNHPDILEAVILDGVAPVTTKGWKDWDDYPAGFQRVFDACAADEACSAAYPDPAGALADGFAALEKTPQPLTIDLGDGEQGTVLVDGDMVVSALYRKREIVPSTAYKLQAKDYSFLATLIPNSLSQGDTRMLMHLPMACSDDPVKSMDEVNTDVPEMYKFLVYDDADNYIAGCPIVNVPQLPDSSDELVVSGIPTLLLNGALDAATPADLAHGLEAGLSNSHYVLFPASGHVQERTPCALDIMDAFMTNPLAEPDVSCIEQQVSFVVPLHATVSSEDGSALLGITLPPGLFTPIEQDGIWQAIDQSASIGLAIFPAGTSAEDALNDFIDNLPLPLENAEIVDGEPIAGYPTKVIQTQLETQGVTVGLDALAFENESGAYRIVWQSNGANLIEPYRELLAALLQTVTIGE